MSLRHHVLRFIRLLEAAPIWAFLGFMKALPRRPAAAVSAALARGVGPLLPVARVARRNLALCFPDKTPAERSAILRGMWDNVGRVAGEFPHRRAMWDPTLRAAADRYGHDALIAAARRGEQVSLVGERIEVVGAEQFAALMDEPRPTILFTAHIGNWELLPWTASRMGLDLAVIYRRPNNPFIARAIEGRRSAKVEFLPKGLQGAFGVARVMERGGCLGVLVDVKENKGISVPFFGKPAMTGVAAATMALRFDALLYGIWTQRLGPGRLRITVEPPLDVARTGDHDADVRAVMAAINARVEAWVRARPDQWLWLHRRWPRDLYR